MKSVLEIAYARRERLLKRTGALRIFHGPSEAVRAGDELSRVAIERFEDANGAASAWVFVWEEGGRKALAPKARGELISFLQGIGVRGAALLERPERGAPADPTALFGELPEFIDVQEEGLLYRIRFLGTKHPGLFLDHAPLREWLRAKGGVQGRRVLNTFSYTGSLSVAARAGGATAVTTLDLSKPTIAWARENWELNFGDPDEAGLPDASGVSRPAGDFIYGDVFEWLPRLEKRGERYDAVILDPPSFSRSPKKVFSTAKDLPALHASALRLLNPSGILITSINSAQISRAQFRAEIEKGAREANRTVRERAPLGAPGESFPGADYLKGWIFDVR